MDDLLHRLDSELEHIPRREQFDQVFDREDTRDDALPVDKKFDQNTQNFLVQGK